MSLSCGLDCTPELCVTTVPLRRHMWQLQRYKLYIYIVYLNSSSLEQTLKSIPRAAVVSIRRSSNFATVKSRVVDPMLDLQ